MPIIKSAKKALRQSKRKAENNKPIKTKARTLLKKARIDPSQENLAAAFSALDKAAKKNIFHRNKVSRLKARLSALASKTETKEVKPKAKKAEPKTKTKGKTTTKTKTVTKTKKTKK